MSIMRIILIILKPISWGLAKIKNLVNIIQKKIEVFKDLSSLWKNLK